MITFNSFKRERHLPNADFDFNLQLPLPENLISRMAMTIGAVYEVLLHLPTKPELDFMHVNPGLRAICGAIP